MKSFHPIILLALLCGTAFAQEPDSVAQLTAEMNTIVDDGRSRVASHEVDRSTLTGKVMVGYQGWFNCEGDGANLGLDSLVAKPAKNLFTGKRYR